MEIMKIIQMEGMEKIYIRTKRRPAWQKLVNNHFIIWPLSVEKFENLVQPK